MVGDKEIAQAALQAVDGLFPESDEISSAELSTDNLPDILALLQKTIDGTKAEIKHIRESQQSEVTAWIQEARQLHIEIAQDHHSLFEITRFESHGAKLDNLVRDLSSQQKLLNTEIVFNKELTTLLSDLKELQDVVRDTQLFVERGVLDSACVRLEDATNLFQKLSELDQIFAVGLMKGNILSLREHLVGEAERCWADLITPDPTNSSLTIQGSVLVGSGSMSGEALIHTLAKLGILEEKLDRLHYRITTILIFPRLHHLSGADYTFATEDNNTKFRLIRRDSPSPMVLSLYADLKLVLNFLTEKLGAPIPRLLSKTLTPAILNILMGSYLPNCIPTDLNHFNDFETLLEETISFEKYLSETGWLDGHGGELGDWVSRAPRIWLNRRRESALDTLRQTFASGLGQRHRVERVERVQEIGGVIAEAPKPIEEAEDNWDTNWDVEIDDEEEKKLLPPPIEPTAPKLKAEPKPLVDEDEDVSGWGFDDDIEIEDVEQPSIPEIPEIKPSSQDGEGEDNWGWGEDDEQQQETSTSQKANGRSQEKEVKNITLRETYAITSIPQEVINIILNTVGEAEKLAQPQYSTLSIATSISGLLAIPASILTLYRALSAIFYRDDPNPAISIYNDCEWLEEHLAGLEKDVKQRSGPFSGFDLQPSIRAISSFGRRAYWREMDTKRIILSDLMDGAQGFDHCTQYPYSENCETAVSSVIHTMQGIEMQWRDTLSRSALLQSLGSLLNTVVLKFINDIEDLGDISADASAKLASYVSEFGKLEPLFKLPDQPADALPMTAVYCEKWLKFQYLGNILDSSMAEIMDLWRDGALVDFDKDELIDLVKALFADGEKRSQVLDELRRG
ncbi:hypothetical protein TWF730_008715 [Orbilia blumenaviensis]|uniref:Retrograde transport protein Dsl1 C-terminal domain-containing protein n=1 Tax=Orbilia blumenaviensis TaxID=1796055 RepID=A0AAV9V667_9PEZI